MKAGHVESKVQITTTININTATKSELMLLENIGSKKADSIIEYRKKHPFQKPEDLMKVQGIGEKIFLSIKDYICVD
jgi:competence protein ComEA